LRKPGFQSAGLVFFDHFRFCGLIERLEDERECFCGIFHLFCDDELAESDNLRFVGVPANDISLVAGHVLAKRFFG